MAELQRKLRDHHMRFINELQVDSVLLDLLLAAKWLTKDEYDQLSSPSMTRPAKVGKLLVTLLPLKCNSDFPGVNILLLAISCSGQQTLLLSLGLDLNAIEKECPDEVCRAFGILDCQPSQWRNVVQPHDQLQAHYGHPGAASHSSYATNAGLSNYAHQGPPVHGGSQPAYATNPSSYHQYQPTPSSNPTAGHGHMQYQRTEPTGNGPVLIVYAAEDVISDQVLALSDFLHECGIDCTIDHYHSNENILNWSQWVEEKMKLCAESGGFILLICTPRLLTSLENYSSSVEIQMQYARITNLALYSLLSNPQITAHVIPVFFTQHVSMMLPNYLAGRTNYRLNMEYLQEMPAVDPDAMLSQSQLASLKSLVSRLTGQVEVPKPPVNEGNPVFVAVPQFHPAPLIGSHPIHTQQYSHPENSTSSDVDDTFLKDIACKVGKDWSRLGVRLGVPFSKLEEFRKVSGPVENQALKMLEYWRYKVPDGTCRKTRKVVQSKLEEMHLANKKN